MINFSMIRNRFTDLGTLGTDAYGGGGPITHDYTDLDHIYMYY